MSVPLVTNERDGNIATISYHRPERLNAINGAMRADLNAAWERFRADEDAWVAIITGTGRAFCVGADLADGAGSAGTWPGSFWEIPTVNSFESGLEVWKPTIAAVNGYCLGYGLTMAAACDFVLAVQDAYGVPAGDERQRLAHELVWDRVEITVEAYVRRLARAGDLHEVGLESMLRQGQQTRALLLECLLD